MPGKHDALATIVDAQTKDGYESVEFTIKVVDYAFDHVSTPLMSKASSAFFGIVSAGSFVLTSLKEIDIALGLTAGTAAATLTAIILGWGYLPFHVPKTVERGIRFEARGRAVAKTPGHGKGHRVGSRQGAVDGRVPVAALRRRDHSLGGSLVLPLRHQLSRA